MAFFSEFFFSAIIGKPVYTVDEKYYGNFRDFIVRRQQENFVITKVRIRRIDGQRVIIPWHDVHSLEADPVSLKLKKKWKEILSVDYGDDELRLKRDFLDQQIVDTGAHRVVRVNDLKIVAVKDEFFMVAADIGLRGLMRRIGLEKFALWIAHLFNLSFQNVLVPSKYIDPLPARLRHDITLTVAQEKLKDMHPADLADILGDLDDFERASILHSLPPGVVAKAVAELSPRLVKKLFGKLKDETVTKILERLSPNTATNIMSQLPRRRMQYLLNRMEEEEASTIKEFLKFKKNTAGSIMNPDVVFFQETQTAGEALQVLRSQGSHAEHIYYIYVIDKEHVLKGVISLRDLIFVDTSSTLASFMKKNLVHVRAKEHVDEVLEKFTKYNLIAIPVVDRNKKLRGMITVDDVLPLVR